MGTRTSIRLLVPMFVCIVILAVWLQAEDGQAAIRFTLSCDREEYYLYEPIHVELCFANAGHSVVRLAGLEDSLTLILDDAFGSRIIFGATGHEDFDLRVGPPIVELAPGRETRETCEMRTFMTFPPAEGKHRLSVMYRPPEWKNTWSQQISSEPVTIQFAMPTGEEAKAAALVRDALKRPGAGGYGQPVYFLDPDLCEAIIAQTQSARFIAAAAYGLAYHALSPDTRSRNAGDIESAVRNLRICISSGSSDYLRGLCYYELLRCKVEWGAAIPEDEVRQITEILQTKYAYTWPGVEAKRLLAKAAKEPPAAKKP